MKEMPAQEILSTEREPLSDECRESLLQYLRESSDNALGEEIRLPTQDEATAAEGLLSLELPGADWEPNRHFTFSDSNYNHDKELWEKVMKEYGLTDCELRRHDIVLTRDNGIIPVKVINLVQVTVDEESNNKYVNLPNGILFMGKTIFKGQHSKYIELNEEELEYIKSFVQKSKTK